MQMHKEAKQFYKTKDHGHYQLQDLGRPQEVTLWDRHGMSPGMDSHVTTALLFSL